MALAFGEDRHQHVGPGHFLAARRLHMDGGALHDALEAVGGARFLAPLSDEIFEFRIDVVDHLLAQGIEVDVAGAQHGGRVGVVNQRQQQMLERGEFLTSLVGVSERPAEGLSWCRLREERGPWGAYFLHHRIGAGCWLLRA